MCSTYTTQGTHTRPKHTIDISYFLLLFVVIQFFSAFAFAFSFLSMFSTSYRYETMNDKAHCLCHTWSVVHVICESLSRMYRRIKSVNWIIIVHNKAVLFYYFQTHQICQQLVFLFSVFLRNKNALRDKQNACFWCFDFFVGISFLLILL